MFGNADAAQTARQNRPAHRIAQYLAHSNTATVESVHGRFRPDHLRDEADTLELPNAVERSG